MELPQSKLHQEFAKEIRILEAKILKIADGAAPQEQYDNSQEKLDLIAKRYQHKEELGSFRYKLYELQALLYYAQERDNEAKSFIEAAIDTRGSLYTRAEKLLEKLNLSSEQNADEYLEINEENEELSKEERRKRQIGLEGWLAVFIIGVTIGIILNVISLLEYPSAFNDVKLTGNTSADIASDFMPILWFEVIMHLMLIGTSIYLLFLLAKRKTLAKTVAIVLMCGAVLYGIVDYAWGSSLYEKYELDTSDLTAMAGDIGRSILYALVWIPYFLIAKRVKATLTK